MDLSQQSYEYNAPTYVDFRASDLHEDDGADRFFDLPLKLEMLDLKTSPVEVKIDPVKIKAEQNVENEELVTVKEEVPSPVPPNLGNANVLSEMCLNTMHYKIVNANQKRTASPVYGQPQKFISLAEGVLHFAKDTPPRFRSYPKNKVPPARYKSFNQKLTIPRSPCLASISRNRPVDYPTREEREEAEVEEMKKFKLKANPVSEKVLNPPQLGVRVENKPRTKIEPFKLTEFKKKEFREEPRFIFTANPVPTGLFEHPIGVPKKKEIPLTCPRTPAITKPKKVMVLEEKDCETYFIQKDTFNWGVPFNPMSATTECKPFTFEERDKLIFKKKEEKIKKVLEEEKKAREFRAGPIPRFLKKMQSNSASESSSSVSTASCGEHTSFKARPADVIHKEPFVPKKPDREAVKPDHIVLHTEIRAEERKIFDLKMEEKDQFIRSVVQKRQEEEEKRDVEERERIRQSTVFKANPMPSYNIAHHQVEMKSPTVPHSPCFSDRFKKK